MHEAPTTKEEWILLLNEWVGYLTAIVVKYCGASNHFERAIDEENWERAVTIMNTAWFNSPDNPSVHSIPGWGVLCDLCSECWVFEEEGTADVG